MSNKEKDYNACANLPRLKFASECANLPQKNSLNKTSQNLRSLADAKLYFSISISISISNIYVTPLPVFPV